MSQHIFNEKHIHVHLTISMRRDASLATYNDLDQIDLSTIQYGPYYMEHMGPSRDGIDQQNSFRVQDIS